MAVALIRFKDHRLEERVFKSLRLLNSFWIKEIIYRPVNLLIYCINYIDKLLDSINFKLHTYNV